MSGEVESSRPSALEIYERVRTDACEELERPAHALGFSGLFAGFTLGATATAYAAATVYVDDASTGLLVAALLYPIGYVGAILGRAQLFTENTLYPVVLCFEERRYIPRTARFWAVVLAANIVGALLFALIASQSAALPADVAAKVSDHGAEAVLRPTWTTFWAAVLAGWLLALVAWTIESSDSAIGALAMIWAIVLVVGLLKLDHSVATAVSAWAALLEGKVSVASAAGWEAVTVLGNAVGGVFIVSVVNYGQVHAEDEEEED